MADNKFTVIYKAAVAMLKKLLNVMKAKKRIVFIVAGAAVVLALVTIVFLPSHSSNQSANDTTAPLADATALYQNATDRLLGADALELTVSQTKETVIGSEAFIEKSEQRITYSALNTDQPAGMLTEAVTIGTHDVSIQELFIDGVGYFTVAGAHFQGNITFQEYQGRYLPAVPFCTDLYRSITVVNDGDTAVITLTNATGIEDWCNPGGVQFVSAEGTAYLDSTGSLTKYQYKASYSHNNIFVRFDATVQINTSPSSVITPPTDTSAYKKIDNLDGPRMLEKACGHLLKAGSVTAKYTDTISCQAFGDHRTQSVTLNLVDTTQFLAKIDTTLAISNSGKLGPERKIRQTERFTDGVYQITTDSSTPTGNTDIDTEAMRQYSRDLLIGTIALPQYITGVNVSESEDNYRIDFTANEEFAKNISQQACKTLYQDELILSKQSQEYKTNAISCYLTIHKETGLPVASGFQYKGTYTIDALPYQLIYQADQQYDLITDHAYRNITES